jgi:hypothetical protein
MSDDRPGEASQSHFEKQSDDGGSGKNFEEQRKV